MPLEPSLWGDPEEWKPYRNSLQILLGLCSFGFSRTCPSRAGLQELPNWQAALYCRTGCSCSILGWQFSQFTLSKGLSLSRSHSQLSCSFSHNCLASMSRLLSSIGVSSGSLLSFQGLPFILYLQAQLPPLLSRGSDKKSVWGCFQVKTFNHWLNFLREFFEGRRTFLLYQWSRSSTICLVDFTQSVELSNLLWDNWNDFELHCSPFRSFIQYFSFGLRLFPPSHQSMTRMVE